MIYTNYNNIKHIIKKYNRVRKSEKNIYIIDPRNMDEKNTITLVDNIDNYNKYIILNDDYVKPMSIDFIENDIGFSIDTDTYDKSTYRPNIIYLEIIRRLYEENKINRIPKIKLEKGIDYKSFKKANQLSEKAYKALQRLLIYITFYTPFDYQLMRQFDKIKLIIFDDKNDFVKLLNKLLPNSEIVKYNEINNFIIKEL